MKAISTINRTRLTGTGRRKPGYWSGFSVCMFVVLLAVFTWAVHRRLTQYESLHQAGGHHMTATKVCLTERPQVSVPTEQRMSRPAMLFLALVLAFALLRLDEGHGSSPREEHAQRSRGRLLHPGLTHFFFLPPPGSLLYL
jgi:hypothetical protein